MDYHLGPIRLVGEKKNYTIHTPEKDYHTTSEREAVDCFISNLAWYTERKIIADLYRKGEVGDIAEWNENQY